MTYHLYYFSATGNTAFSAARIASALEKQGHSVNSVSINCKTRPLEKAPDALVVAYPTLAGRPPSLVMRFCKSLPRGTKNGSTIEAAILGVTGGQPFRGPEVLARILRKRGYEVTLSAAANFSDNWTQMVAPPTEEKRPARNAEGISQVDTFISKLTEGSVSLYKGRLSHEWMNTAGKLFQIFGRRFLGKLYIADNECNSCGKCAKTCPAGAISLIERKPFWNLACESCNRCINICPQKAINTSNARTAALIALIGIICAGLVITYGHTVAPLYAGLNIAIHRILSIAGYSAVVFAAHILPLTLFDRFLLFPLQRTRGGGKLFGKSFTKTFPRYVFPGYNPPAENLQKGKK